MSEVPSTAARWAEAERLFRSDDRWIGGDDAYSIPLDDERRLWLFGDSFIAGTAGGDRRGAAFINNSIGIQHGADPATAAMEFAWGGDGTDPDAFFPAPGGDVYRWPGHGALIGDTLLLFFMLVHDVPSPPDQIETLTFFEIVGWDALAVDVTSHEPGSWRPRTVSLPEAPFADLVGNGGVLVDDGFLHAHAWRDGSTFLARWPVSQAADADLRQPEWWCGPHDGWSREPDPEPHVTLGEVETEFTVHRDRAAGRFVHIQMAGLGQPRLELRVAPDLHGPWSTPAVLFRPREHRDAFTYAGKAHPGLAADGLAATFNTIPYTLDAIRERPDLYVPRVVRVPEAGLRSVNGEPLT